MEIRVFIGNTCEGRVVLTSPIDALVGQRIKQRRQILRMTQSDLADQIDVRFQQIQKYESGQNRVAASRLWFIARVLKVPVTYFFDEDEDDSDNIAQDARPRVHPQHQDVIDLMETLSERQKKALIGFLRALSNENKQVRMSET